MWLGSRESYNTVLYDSLLGSTCNSYSWRVLSKPFHLECKTSVSSLEIAKTALQDITPTLHKSMSTTGLKTFNSYHLNNINIPAYKHDIVYHTNTSTTKKVVHDEFKTKQSKSLYRRKSSTSQRRMYGKCGIAKQTARLSNSEREKYQQG